MATVNSKTVFATGGTGASGLDSLTTGGRYLWAEYSNGADSTGKGGSSTIVQYNQAGKVVRTFTVAGSDDGLKVDPYTGIVWVLQNQDGNATLTLINPETDKVSAALRYAAPYQYGPNSGRGYDDVGFIGNKVFLSYTNPVNPGDAVVQELTNGGAPFGPLTTTNILSFGAVGTNLETGKQGVIPLSDPDSLKVTPNGGLVLTSGADNTFALIDHPGEANQTVSYVQLQDLPAGSALDDVIVPGAQAGTLYIADQGHNRILKVEVQGLTHNDEIVSIGSEVGIVDNRTGKVTPLVTGLSKSHGLSWVRESYQHIVESRVAAEAPKGATQPDSLTFDGTSLWVEYGNGASSTGGPGFSTIVEYAQSGRIEQEYHIRGSVDGLKVNPVTGDVWALSNQDGNSVLRLIDPATHQVSGPLYYAPPYVYGANSTQGYDDVAFSGGKVFLSATNPSHNGDPVIQQLLNGNSPFGALYTKTILEVGDKGTNLTTGQHNQLLPDSDPDSLKSLADGTLVLTSDNAHALIFLFNPGQASQHAAFVNLPASASGLDDTVIPSSTSGTFYVAETGANRVDAFAVTGLNTHDIYLSLSSANAIVQLNPYTGNVSTVVGNLASPHGLLFVPSSDSHLGIVDTHHA